MKTKRLIGAILLASPFISVFIAQYISSGGLFVPLMAFGTTALIVCVVIAGCKLLWE